MPQLVLAQRTPAGHFVADERSTGPHGHAVRGPSHFREAGRFSEADPTAAAVLARQRRSSKWLPIHLRHRPNRHPLTLLLQALQRRGVYVPMVALNGDFGRVLSELLSQRRAETLHVVDDEVTLMAEYEAELLDRALRCLDEILSANAASLFPEERRPAAIFVKGTSLVIVRTTGIEFRSCRTPNELFGLIPMGKPALRGAAVCNLGGSTTVLAHNGERVFARQPSRSSLPIADYPVDEGIYDDAVAHSTTACGLRTILVTEQAHTLQELLDLRQKRSVPLKAGIGG